MIAITRAVSPRIVECELTCHDREPIDAARASAQHERYEQWLDRHGARIVRADPAPEHPDGVFVEDAAVVLDEIAIITRPGAESRRGETDSVARLLHDYRPLHRIEEPATIDGGDVLTIGRSIFVGQSTRTNDLAVEQLREIVTPHGYEVTAVPLRECLHLKSAATAVGDGTLLVNPRCVDRESFPGLEVIAVPETEPGAANVLRLAGALLISSSYPETRRMLQHRGLAVETIDYQELEKAEAGVTCCSILFRGPSPGREEAPPVTPE